MAYDKQLWNDNAGPTAMEAESFNHIEAGIKAAHAAAAAATALVRALADRVWTQATEPPAGTWHRWTGTPDASTSERVVNATVAATNYITNPDMRTSVGGGTTGAFPFSGQATEQNVLEGSESLSRWTLDTTGAIGINFNLGPFSSDPHLVMMVRASRAITVVPRVNYVSGPAVVLPVGEWVEVKASPSTTSSSSTLAGLRIDGTAGHQIGDTVDVQHLAVMDARGPYFDGDSPGDRARDLWVNTADADRVYVWDNGWVLPS